MHYFNPICEFITIRFICPDCKEEVVSDALSVPSPDFAAENNSDSMNYEDYEVECENCGRSFQVTVYNSMYDGEVEVEDVDEMDVEEEYPEGDEFEDYVFDLTPERITSVIDEIEPLFYATNLLCFTVSTSCIASLLKRRVLKIILMLFQLSSLIFC